MESEVKEPNAINQPHQPFAWNGNGNGNGKGDGNGKMAVKEQGRGWEDKDDDRAATSAVSSHPSYPPRSYSFLPSSSTASSSSAICAGCLPTLTIRSLSQLDLMRHSPLAQSFSHLILTLSYRRQSDSTAVVECDACAHGKEMIDCMNGVWSDGSVRTFTIIMTPRMETHSQTKTGARTHTHATQQQQQLQQRHQSSRSTGDMNSSPHPDPDLEGQARSGVADDSGAAAETSNQSKAQESKKDATGGKTSRMSDPTSSSSLSSSPPRASAFNSLVSFHLFVPALCVFPFAHHVFAHLSRSPPLQCLHCHLSASHHPTAAALSSMLARRTKAETEVESESESASSSPATMQRASRCDTGMKQNENDDSDEDSDEAEEQCSPNTVMRRQNSDITRRTPGYIWDYLDRMLILRRRGIRIHPTHFVITSQLTSESLSVSHHPTPESKLSRACLNHWKQWLLLMTNNVDRNEVEGQHGTQEEEQTGETQQMAEQTPLQQGESTSQKHAATSDTDGSGGSSEKCRSQSNNDSLSVAENVVDSPPRLSNHPISFSSAPRYAIGPSWFETEHLANCFPSSQRLLSGICLRTSALLDLVFAITRQTEQWAEAEAEAESRPNSMTKGMDRSVDEDEDEVKPQQKTDADSHARPHSSTSTSASTSGRRVVMRHTPHLNLMGCFHCNEPALNALDLLPDLRRLDMIQLHNGHDASYDYTKPAPWSQLTLNQLQVLALCGFRSTPIPLFRRVVFHQLHSLHIHGSHSRIPVNMSELTPSIPNVTHLHVSGLYLETLDDLAPLRQLHILSGLMFPFSCCDREDLGSAILPSLTHLHVSKQRLGEATMHRIGTTNPHLAACIGALRSFLPMSGGRLQWVEWEDFPLISASYFCHHITLAIGHDPSAQLMLPMESADVRLARKMFAQRAEEYRTTVIVERRMQKLMKEAEERKMKHATDGNDDALGSSSYPVLSIPSPSSTSTHRPAVLSLSLCFRFLRLADVFRAAQANKLWYDAATNPIAFSLEDISKPQCRTGLTWLFRRPEKLRQARNERLFKCLRFITLDLTQQPANLLGQLALLGNKFQRIMLTSAKDLPRPYSTVEVDKAIWNELKQTAWPPTFSDLLHVTFLSPCMRSIKRLGIQAPLRCHEALLSNIADLANLERLAIDVVSLDPRGNLIPLNLCNSLRLPNLQALIVRTAYSGVAQSTPFQSHRPLPRATKLSESTGLRILSQLATEGKHIADISWHVVIDERVMDTLRPSINTNAEDEEKDARQGRPKDSTPGEDDGNNNEDASVSPLTVPRIESITLSSFSSHSTSTYLSLFTSLRHLLVCDFGTPQPQHPAWPRSLNMTLRELIVRIQPGSAIDSQLLTLAHAQLDQLEYLHLTYPLPSTISHDITDVLCPSLPSLTDISLSGLVFGARALKPFGQMKNLRRVSRLQIAPDVTDLSVPFIHVTHLTFKARHLPSSYAARPIIFSLPSLQSFLFVGSGRRTGGGFGLDDGAQASMDATDNNADDVDGDGEMEAESANRWGVIEDHQPFSTLVPKKDRKGIHTYTIDAFRRHCMEMDEREARSKAFTLTLTATTPFGTSSNGGSTGVSGASPFASPTSSAAQSSSSSFLIPTSQSQSHSPSQHQTPKRRHHGGGSSRTTTHSHSRQSSARRSDRRTIGSAIAAASSASSSSSHASSSSNPFGSFSVHAFSTTPTPTSGSDLTSPFALPSSSSSSSTSPFMPPPFSVCSQTDATTSALSIASSNASTSPSASVSTPFSFSSPFPQPAHATIVAPSNDLTGTTTTAATSHTTDNKISNPFTQCI